MKFEEAMDYSDKNNDLKLLKMISSQEMSSQGGSLMTSSLEVSAFRMSSEKASSFMMTSLEVGSLIMS